MSILSLTDIIPEQLPTDLIVDQQHAPSTDKKGGTGNYPGPLSHILEVKQPFLSDFGYSYPY